jgi:hypothetical protein
MIVSGFEKTAADGFLTPGGQDYSAPNYLLEHEVDGFAVGTGGRFQLTLIFLKGLVDESGHRGGIGFGRLA